MIRDFGSRLSRCRQNKNMTQEELAGRIGITPQALSKYERGQSLPDIAILPDICFVLDVSADYMLGLEGNRFIEDGNDKRGEEILRNLRGCISPLELSFGEGFLSFLEEKNFVDTVMDVRRALSYEGILMPVVRLRDDLTLEKNAFRITSYRQVLYEERVELNEEVYGYMMQKLLETVRKEYANILNRDLVKELVDNLGRCYPTLIEETIPAKISYGELTRRMKDRIAAGGSMAELFQVLEEV